MKDETDNLKSEITRLNRIITVLIDQVSALMAENRALKIEKGIENSFYTDADFSKGIKNDINTNATFEKGINNDNDTHAIFDKGIKNSNDTDATSDIGIKNEKDTDANFGKGIKNLFNTNTKTGTAPAKGIGNAEVKLPHYIEADNANLTKLAKHLKQFLPDTRQRNALHAVARELLLLYNASLASSRELRKAAGLSKPGFAKHLPKLRRRGLITKAPPLKYKLTDYSRGMIAKVFE